MSRSKLMGPCPFLLIFVLGYCLAVIEGELRCYCNESGCVSTGYMCKSSAGQCFTAVEVRAGKATHLTHGCVETLPEPHRATCRVGVDLATKSVLALAAEASSSARSPNAEPAGGSSSPSQSRSQPPLLLCCTEHMCNYRDDVVDVNVILTPPKHKSSSGNGTLPRGIASVPSDDTSIFTHNHPNNREDDRDLWFKAAVIAVPIAGGFILVLLVLLAVRMLKTDSHHHRRLIQFRRQHSLTKAHMYITDHFMTKAPKQHCSLFNEKHSRACAPLFSEKPMGSHNSSNNNSNNSNSNRNSSASCLPPCFNENSTKQLYSQPSHEQTDVYAPGLSPPSNNLTGHGAPSSGVSRSGGGPSSSYMYSPAFTTSPTAHICSSCADNNHCHSGACHLQAQPCSFYSDSPCLPGVDRGRPACVPVSLPPETIVQHASAHQHVSIANWDKARTKGPMAIV